MLKNVIDVRNVEGLDYGKRDNGFNRGESIKLYHGEKKDTIYVEQPPFF